VRVRLVAVSLSPVSIPPLPVRTDANICESAPATAPVQNNGAQQVSQPNSAAPVRVTPAAVVTPPTSNSSQKVSPGNGPPSSKSTGNKNHKHKHKGSQKAEGKTSEQQTSKKVDGNIVVSKYDDPARRLLMSCFPLQKRDFTSLSRAMAERHWYIRRALAGQ
jgi:hypothetical protein